MNSIFDVALQKERGVFCRACALCSPLNLVITAIRRLCFSPFEVGWALAGLWNESVLAIECTSCKWLGDHFGTKCLGFLKLVAEQTLINPFIHQGHLIRFPRVCKVTEQQAFSFQQMERITNYKSLR